MRAAISVCALALLGGLALSLCAPAASRAATSYCSPETGDYCLGVTKRKGYVELVLSTFSFRGRVRICISHEKATDCRRFRLQRDPSHDIYSVDVRWSAHFPDRGPGLYRVRFSWSGYRIGIPVDFRRV